MTLTAPPVHRSFSQLKQLRTCGEQYRLERIVRVPSRPSVPAVAGVVVHSATEVIDHLLHNGQADTTDIYGQAQATADSALSAEIAKLSAAGKPPEGWRHFGKQDLDWFRTVGIPNSLAAYLAWREQNPDWVLAEIPGFGPAIEVPFNLYVWPGRLVHGFIDRVFTSRTQGGYYCGDIKSGKKPDTDEQLGLYSAALREGLGWTVTHGFYVYGLKSGTASLSGPHDITHWTQEKLGTAYEKASLVIEQGLFIPNPGDSCFVCSVWSHCDFRASVI